YQNTDYAKQKLQFPGWHARRGSNGQSPVLAVGLKDEHRRQPHLNLPARRLPGYSQTNGYLYPKPPRAWLFYYDALKPYRLQTPISGQAKGSSAIRQTYHEYHPYQNTSSLSHFLADD